MNNPVSYATKSFTMPMGIALIIIVQVSMGLMMIPILLGLHFLVAMAALIGSIYFCIAMLSGETIYTVNEEGLSVQVRPKLPWKWWKFQKKKFYPWSSISSYSIGEDMTRGMEKFHFISVVIKGLGNDLKISDNAKYFEGFEEFKKAFVELVNERNTHVATEKVSSSAQAKASKAATSSEINRSTKIHPSKEKPIARTPSFYERPLAKVVTLLFAVFVAGLFVFYFYNPQFLKWQHVVKISIVIMPGLGYMFYRSFMEKN